MTDDRAEIEKVLERVGRAHRDKEADEIVGCYLPYAVIYGPAPPLRERMDRDSVAAWLETWGGPIRIPAAEHVLTVEGGLAWSTALNRMRGTKTDGTKEDMWFRTTMCLRMTEEGWRIADDHSSTPFYMDGSMRAATNLTPESEGEDA
jgi:ketosteroid isomerase-like protein